MNDKDFRHMRDVTNSMEMNLYAIKARLELQDHNINEIRYVYIHSFTSERPLVVQQQQQKGVSFRDNTNLLLEKLGVYEKSAKCLAPSRRTSL
jgi:hypothetical protein